MGRRAKTTSATVARRVIGYVRVSSVAQATEGLSLEAQRAQLVAYGGAYGLDLVGIEVDGGVSAATLQRPGLARALGMLASGAADGLLVCKLDRLTRSLRDLGDLLAGPFAPGKAALLSVGEHLDTSSASGRLLLNILTSVAAWEREACGERTSAVKARQRERGEFTGGRVPYGFALDGDLRERMIALPGEQATIARARELSAGGLSLGKVAARLSEEGRYARNGRVFHPQQVANMLGSAEAA